MAGPMIKELLIEETFAPMVVVLGQTGSGKSHFINKLAGREVVKESPRLFSCTKKPELVEIQVNEFKFLMVDTPGFNDTWRDSTRSDGKILSEIARTLTLQTELGVQLRGILFLYDIRDTRMTGDKRRHIEMIKLICGKDNYANVMLVTTNWPKTLLEQNDQGCPLREADLRTEFWKDMIKGGSKMVRFDNDQDTAKAIVGSLAAKPNITLALQKEMASGTSLLATSAGTFIVNARQEDEKALKMLVEKTQKSTSEPENTELVQEISRLQQSVESRKSAEGKLHGDVIGKIRREISSIYEETRRRGKKITAANIFAWLIGVSGMTANVVQLALSGAS